MITKEILTGVILIILFGCLVTYNRSNTVKKKVDNFFYAIRSKAKSKVKSIYNTVKNKLS